MAYKIVINWKGAKQESQVQTNKEVAFVNQGDEEQAMVNENKGEVCNRSRKLVKCNKCGGKHWSNKCTKGNKTNNRDRANNDPPSNAPLEKEDPKRKTRPRD